MQLYAVIRSGDHEYRVTPGSVVNVDRLEAEPGQIIELDEVSKVVRGDEAAGTGCTSTRRGRQAWTKKRCDCFQDETSPSIQGQERPGISIHRVAHPRDRVWRRSIQQARCRCTQAEAHRRREQAEAHEATASTEPPIKQVVQPPVAETVNRPAATKPVAQSPAPRESRNRLPMVAALLLLLVVASFFFFRSPSPAPTPVPLQDAQPVDRPIDPTQPPD